MRVRRVAATAGLAVLMLLLGASAASAAGSADEELGTYKDKASMECADKLAEGKSLDACHDSPILPATNELIWGSLSFVALLVVMWKFALPPVRNMMKNREDGIRADLDRAENAKQEAETVLSEYRAQLADARDEAGHIIEEARAAADAMRRDLTARAESEAADLRARAAEDIRLAGSRAMADLQSRVADLSIELAERIVERSLDRDTQLALVESYISEVGSR